MSKRQLWVINCLLWAGIWFVFGLFFMPIWIFTVLALLMIMLPVGVPEAPAPKVVPNPAEWGKHTPSKES